MQEPSPWVERYLGGARAGGKVLDVACGAGRHIGLSLDLGYHVTGVDRDISRPAQAFGGRPSVELLEADLEGGQAFPFPPGTFDAVIVTNYLWRPILPAIVAAVAPAGMLLYETFRAGNQRYGKPSRPDFLLRPGELIEAVRGKLIPIAYEDVTLTDPDRCVQRICAVGAGHSWIDEPLRLGEARSSEGVRS